MSIEPINLVGAGGQGAVVLDALLAAGVPPQTIAIWTQDAAAADGKLLGQAIRYLSTLDQLHGQDFHVCIGDNATRQSLHLSLVALGASARTVFHPAATVSTYANLSAGIFAAAHSVVAPGAQIGVGAIINHGAVVDHDCRIGDFVHVAPGATLGGGVHVDDLVLVGAGANILPRRHIGSRAIVGAGAVVLSGVPERDIFIGIPAASKPQRRS